MTTSLRPSASARRLPPGQISELVIADREGTDIRVIYATADLIEAPNWTLDGRHLIYNADGRLFRISVDGQDGPCRINTAPVENLNNDHVLAPDGESLYLSANDGHLYRVPVTGGVPVRVSPDQPAEKAYSYYLHGISPDRSTLAYVAVERTPAGATLVRLATLPADGGAETYLTDGRCPVDGPEFDPTGEFIYFSGELAAKVPGHAQIFRMNRDGSGVEQLTFDDRVNWFPHLSPDGSLIAYVSFPPGTTGHPPDKDVIIRTMRPDGSGIRDIDAFNGGQGTINVASWAPDSGHFAYVRFPFIERSGT